MGYCRGLHDHTAAMGSQLNGHSAPCNKRLPPYGRKLADFGAHHALDRYGVFGDCQRGLLFRRSQNRPGAGMVVEASMDMGSSRMLWFKSWLETRWGFA